jgi:hypothetical protein
MTANTDLRRAAFKIVPLVLVPVVFFAAKGSLASSFGASGARLIGAATSIFVMGYALYLSAHVHRAQDEVQKASAGFAAQWGTAAGQVAFLLFLMLPPFVDIATAIVSDFVDGPAGAIDRRVVRLAMTLGFMGVVFLQTIGVFVFNAIWWKAKQ